MITSSSNKSPQAFHKSSTVPVNLTPMQFLYFSMRACAMAGFLLDVNPFNQPGVEIYKKNMFKLLGKKGY